MQNFFEDASLPPTLSTSYIVAQRTFGAGSGYLSQQTGIVVAGNTNSEQWENGRSQLQSMGLTSTGKGILIGMLSAFGSAGLIALILAIVYFFRFTNRGRIFLDRIGRPGEYDDEQAFLREEEDALEEMDDLQRAEYMRAKGNDDARHPRHKGHDANKASHSVRPVQPTRVHADGHLVITVPRHSRKGRIGLGVRTRA